MTTQRTRYLQVGLGVRSWMYSLAIVNDYGDECELVGLCDSNAGRLEQRVGWARSNGVEVASGDADDFDRLLAETRPDVVVVTTTDRHHDRYLCAAMEAGCDVITEKPMTIDAARCQKILDVQKKTGRRCTVTFNYRYSPPRTQVRELLAEGTIGRVLSVDFHWMLDTYHGADYFRRWHRRKENSGGLMVHKATHHFDLVNWWLGSVLLSVYASGGLRFYTPAQADRYGLSRRTERCRGCPEAPRCPFHLDIEKAPELKAIYLDHEGHDGYFRDRCVFSDEIDIEDAVNVVVEYASGATMSYSLNAFMPWEGYTVVFNGTKGRLEHSMQEKVYVSGDGSVPGEMKGAEGCTIRIYPHFGPARDVEPWTGKGAHGGGDRPLLEQVFHPEKRGGEDPHGRAADHRAGAWSILTGIAANESMRSGKPVRIETLVSGLEAPLAAPDEAAIPLSSNYRRAGKPSPLWRRLARKLRGR